MARHETSSIQTVIIGVAFPIPLFKTFDYLVPSEAATLNPESLLGRRVRVSFGYKQSIGIICEVKETSDAPVEKLKPVSQILDEDPLLSPHMMALGQWLSDYTLCSRGEALFALLPPGKNHRDDTDLATHWEASSAQHPRGESGFVYTDDQKKATDEIHASIYANDFQSAPPVFLLRGVAAAGKTEVYFSAIKDILAQGKTALYLVPEIGLSHQSAAMLIERFGEKAVYHWTSATSLKKRAEDWWRIKNHEFSIVVGTRSATLLPLNNLGLIVVDEEHDSAFKDDRKPRFHVRDAVVKRGELEQAVVLLGSATPSLEALELTVDNRARLLELSERAVSTAAPRMHVVDMKNEKKRGVVSERLLSALGETLKNKKQAILFLNRRGFHRYVHCTDCSWNAKCEKCGVSLVLHKEKRPLTDDQVKLLSKLKPKEKRALMVRFTTLLNCHMCGEKTNFPNTCGACHGKNLVSGGAGTEKIEEDIKELFPWAKIERWDSDSSRKKGEGERIFNSFRRGEVEILVGTQLVTQGFHFPGVDLVGVIDADVPLHLPDFRAAEKTFQLVVQVAGRAGRDMVEGNVFIQTWNPDHYALYFASRLDQEGFAEEELKFRKDLNYPPYAHVIEVRTARLRKPDIEKDIAALVVWLEENAGPLEFGWLGPRDIKQRSKSTMGHQVLIKVGKSEMEAFLAGFKLFLKKAPNRYWINVNP